MKFCRRLSSRAMGASWMCTNPYASASTLQLKLPGYSTPMTVHISKAYTPFTNSQTLLVDAKTPNDILPNQFILKLADRRFSIRNGLPPWSPEVEHEFQRYMARHKVEHGTYPIVSADKGFTEQLPAGWDKDDDPPTWFSELWVWSSGERFLTLEANVYRHLEEAQDLGFVPRFYGETQVVMSPETAPDHPAFQSVRGILLEYVPGMPMDSVRIGEDITTEQAEEVSQKLIALGRQIRRSGVSHGDLHFGNIILRSPDRTPVIIDWGRADFEMASNPSLAERWNAPGMAQDLELDIRYWLKYDQKVRWHRHETPHDDATWEWIAQNHGCDVSELWTWALGEMRLTIEANAYRRLVEAQHLGLVPRFYGEAEILMAPELAPNHPVFQSVRGILLEYIPGVPMDSIRVGQDITLEQAEEVSQKLIALGRQIRRYGVMHSDLHFGNIVLRSHDRTPVIIDWGDADWTMADNPSLAERWNRPGMVEGFERGIRIYLKSGQKVPWHRHETPYDDATWRQIARNNDGDERAWKLVNGWVRQDMMENKREGMYIEDTSVDEGRGLRWRIKPGVKTRRLRDPPPDK